MKKNISMWQVKLFFLLWLSRDTFARDWPDWRNAGQLPQRVLELIAAYNERGAAQINEVTDIRSENDDCFPFEMGYVMSEILERYRKMVGLTQRGVKFKMDSLLDMVKHTELIQHMFFEIFHMVNMFNEINKKYSLSPTKYGDANAEAAALISVDLMIKRQKEIDRIRKLEKKKRMKELKKIRQSSLQKGKVADRQSRKPGNKWWPIDYGWEVDYQWWR